MRLTHFRPDFMTGNVHQTYSYRVDDLLELFSAEDEDSTTIHKHRIASYNGNASGVPDSTYNSTPNGSDFFNRTDNKWYHKSGTPGYTDGTWASTGGSGSLLGYQALVSQTGTSNPTATVLGTNGIGTLTWERSSTGTYTATSATAVFTSNKTFPQILNFPVAQSGTEFKADSVVTSTTVLTFTVRDPGGNLVDGFTNMSFKVEVFA